VFRSLPLYVKLLARDVWNRFFLYFGSVSVRFFEKKLGFGLECYVAYSRGQAHMIGHVTIVSIFLQSQMFLANRLSI